MLTPVEKADIIKSVGFMKSELFSIISSKISLPQSQKSGHCSNIALHSVHLYIFFP